MRRSRPTTALVLALILLPCGACRRPPPGPPDAAIGRLNAGIALLEQHRFAQAETEFREALRLFPDFLAARVDLAVALAAQVKYPEAEAELKTALGRAPDNLNALYLTGLLRKYQGDRPAAIAALERVHALDPDDADTKYNLGTLYKDEGDLGRAIPLLEEVIAAQPQFISAFYAVGQALLRSGQVKGDPALVARGEKFIARFQTLSGGAGTATAGLAYGEQGRYALALEDDSPLPIRPAAPVRFVEAAAAVGLDFTGRALDPEHPIGTGVVVFDLDGDGDDDVLLPGPADGLAARFFRNQEGRFADATDSAGLGALRGSASSAAAGDVDHDGDADLILAGHLLLGDGKTFADAGGGSGLGEELAAARAVAFADLDHDGDLDLVATFAAGRGTRTWQNDGRGRFTDTSDATRLPADSPATSVTFTDFDNDRDTDVWVAAASGARLASNRRAEGFRDVTQDLAIQSRPPALGIAAADADGDGFSDLLVTTGSGITFQRNQRGRGFDSPVVLSDRGAAAGALFFDADLDSDLDLVAGDVRGLRFWRNDGHGTFADQSADAGLAAIGSDIRGLACGDLDGDGDLDLVAAVPGGRALYLRNDLITGDGGAAWVKIVPRGLNSNRFGFGTKLEARAGRLRQKIEIQGGAGFLSQSSGTATFAVGERPALDRLRLLWPGGVLQAELELKPRATHVVQELDRKGSSCPFLWAWDGDHLAFVSDIQGGSPLGLWLAPGMHNLPDSDEWFLLPRGLPRLRDGAYDLRISESLEEICYFDRVKLRVVDAPATVAVFPNERLLLAPPFAAAGLHFVSGERPPLQAIDAAGRDVTDRVAAIDRRYAGAVERDRFRGFARPWTLTLDFGTLAPAERRGKVILLAHGYVEFSNSTPMFAAAQAGLHFSLPALDLIDGRGKVHASIADAGAPAGLPKWMVLDLSGKIPPDGRLRLVYRTNMEVYFDQVAIGFGRDVPEATIHDLEPVVADLRFAGYPEPWSPDGGRPMLYRYEPLAGDETWANQAGAYTRLGDVRELLATEDDRLVVMRHGDEIALRFPADTLPPLPPGQERHLILYSVGWAKDLDPHSAAPDSVGPLPYRAMARYPYDGPGLLADPGYRDALAAWSTREVRPRSAGLR